MTDDAVQAVLEDGTLDDLDREQLKTLCMDGLRDRYSREKGWTIFTEVASKGSDTMRMVDAIAVNQWASRGYEVHGFEVKVDRSDWLAELKQPEKSRWWYERCHRWWLVAPTHVADKGELPKGWGWLRLESNGRLRRARSAELREDPILDGPLVGRLARHMAKAMERSPEKEALRQARAEGREEGKEYGRREAGGYKFERLEKKVETYEAQHELFEHVTGVPIVRFTGTVDDDVLRVVGPLAQTRQAVRRAAEDLVRVRRLFRHAADEIDAMLDDLPVDVDEVDVKDSLRNVGGWFR